MKEILYVQAGNFSNYVGAHFWNIQQNYWDDQEAAVDSNVSFREGLNEKGIRTYCPRLLIFDYKTNFGTLAKTNSLVETNEEGLPDEDSSAIWQGRVVEYKQEPIQKSTFRHADTGSIKSKVTLEEKHSMPGNEIRYWSDLSRVSYVPRTIQRIPDPPQWENVEGNWNMGKELFSRYNEDVELMEDSVRLFFEECDHLQGLQVMNDTATFGGFTNSFLTTVRDEFSKLPNILIPFLSDAVAEAKSPQNAVKLVNDALYLRGVNDLSSSLCVPIQAPIVWRKQNPGWSSSLMHDMPPRSKAYGESALIAAHLDSATLPLRTGELGDKETPDDILTLSAMFGGSGPGGSTIPFCQLSGIFPYPSASSPSSFKDLDDRSMNFTSSGPSSSSNSVKTYARLDVTRGFSVPGLETYDGWTAGFSSSSARSYSASEIPLPNYYATIFDLGKTKTSPTLRRRGSHGARHASTYNPAQAFTCLSATSESAALFKTYAESIERYARQRLVGLENTFQGDMSEELTELANDMWKMHDDLSEGFSEGGGDGGRMNVDD